MILKIVQADRASNTDCYGILLLLLWFCVSQTKSKTLGKVKNIKDALYLKHILTRKIITIRELLLTAESQ